MRNNLQRRLKYRYARLFGANRNQAIYARELNEIKYNIIMGFLVRA